MNNSSKLGEEVYLTEDTLVELKLTQKPWTIIIPRRVPSITKVITEIYQTTNLFTVVEGEFPSIVVIPKVNIVFQYSNGWIPLGPLFTGRNYYADP